MTIALELITELLTTYRILLIEDGVSKDLSVQAYFEDVDQRDPDLWQVTQVHSCEAALACMDSASYDAILLFLGQTGKQGLNTLLHVLKEQGTAPVVLVSAQEDQAFGLQAVHYGAQDYLVRETLNQASLKRSLRQSIERQKLVNSFHHAALHDPLTSLANRNLFLTLVQQAIERKNRNPEELYAILFLDLDNFKQINDHYGHLCGDQLLGEIALRLRSSVRACDVVSRLAGDEFGLLIGDLKEPLDVLPVLHRMNQVISQPVAIPGQTIQIGVSMGVSLSDSPGLTAIELLENADLAMYQAKLNGKGTYCVFNERMEYEKNLLCQLEQGLQQELHHHACLRMCYRPVVSLQQGHILGMEADVLYQSPSWQSVPFTDVLRLASGSGLLDRLNHWILSEIRQQTQSWDKRHPLGWKIFLQLAPEQIKAREFQQQLQNLLLENQLPPERLYLSLNESMLAHSFNFQELLPLLKELHKQGFKLYLDHFAGSYTVLQSFCQIPIDMVRLNLTEMSARLPTGTGLQLVLEPVIQLARNLGLEVLIDGVRSEHDLSLLPCHQAIYAQGSFFSAPVSGKEVEVWL